MGVLITDLASKLLKDNSTEKKNLKITSIPICLTRMVVQNLLYKERSMSSSALLKTIDGSNVLATS